MEKGYPWLDSLDVQMSDGDRARMVAFLDAHPHTRRVEIPGCFTPEDHQPVLRVSLDELFVSSSVGLVADAEFPIWEPAAMTCHLVSIRWDDIVLCVVHSGNAQLQPFARLILVAQTEKEHRAVGAKLLSGYSLCGSLIPLQETR